VKRADGRAYDELRPVRITPGYQSFAEGSALIEQGKTRVLCSATIEDRVRSARDISVGRIAGRSQEIQRLIGRSMRAAVDLAVLGERSLIIDCDVLQADGGTRTAAITGGYVALHQALETAAGMGMIPSLPLRCAVAATSVGVAHQQRLLDLCYDEDFNAEVDFNVVMTSQGEFVEVQGTAEGRTFNKETIDFLLELAEKGIRELFQIQKEALDALRGKQSEL